MIGKIKKVPLRTVWKNEASHFTTWLAENIDQLSEAIGVEFTVKEREQDVGSFSLDILAEAPDGSLVVIENQLEKTDHTHLGQIMTYLTNLNAKIAIWITSEARQEHINVINWLNEQTECHFYLVVVEAISIDSSSPAPYFNVISKPDEQIRSIGIHKKELGEYGKFNLAFWKAFIEKCNGRLSMYSTRSPTQYHYLGGSSGKSGLVFTALATRSFIAVELYIDVGDADQNEIYLNELKSHKIDIEKAYGFALSWDSIETKRACRIRHVIEETNITEADQNTVIEKLIKHMEKFEAALKQKIKKLSDHREAA